MANHFYAYISRMRCVKRWALMRNTEEENIQEHSHMVAVLAHALALIRTRVYGIPTDANAVAVAARSSRTGISTCRISAAFVPGRME